MSSPFSISSLSIICCWTSSISSGPFNGSLSLLSFEVPSGCWILTTGAVSALVIILSISSELIVVLFGSVAVCAFLSPYKISIESNTDVVSKFADLYFAISCLISSRASANCFFCSLVLSFSGVSIIFFKPFLTSIFSIILLLFIVSVISLYSFAERPKASASFKFVSNSCLLFLKESSCFLYSSIFALMAVEFSFSCVFLAIYSSVIFWISSSDNCSFELSASVWSANIFFNLSYDFSYSSIASFRSIPIPAIALFKSSICCLNSLKSDFLDKVASNFSTLEINSSTAFSDDEELLRLIKLFLKFTISWYSFTIASTSLAIISSCGWVSFAGS